MCNVYVRLLISYLFEEINDMYLKDFFVSYITLYKYVELLCVMYMYVELLCVTGHGKNELAYDTSVLEKKQKFYHRAHRDRFDFFSVWGV